MLTPYHCWAMQGVATLYPRPAGECLHRYSYKSPCGGVDPKLGISPPAPLAHDYLGPDITTLLHTSLFPSSPPHLPPHPCYIFSPTFTSHIQTTNLIVPIFFRLYFLTHPSITYFPSYASPNLFLHTYIPHLLLNLITHQYHPILLLCLFTYFTYF